MKKLIIIRLLALILCFMVGCQDKEAMVELEAMKAQAEVEEQNKDIVRRYFELMDEGNPEFLELLSEDYIAHFPGGFDIKGRDVIKKFSDEYFIGFPNLTHFFLDFVAEGDKVTMRYGDKGTHQGVFDGILPTGVEMKMTAIGIFRIKDGKMVECWIEADYLGMKQQLGMELKPKEETETHKEASPGEHAREGQDEHSEEGRGEHSGEGEETGQTFTLNETYDNIRKGVRLILSYDKASSSFIGTVENVTNRTIKSVRVEVHLSNGMELGPTSPIDLAPGKKTSVKLSAAGQSFNWWKAHPEAGSGEHSGEG